MVPGDWNSQDDKLFWYEGTIWYRTRFDFAPARRQAAAVPAFRRR